MSASLAREREPDARPSGSEFAGPEFLTLVQDKTRRFAGMRQARDMYEPVWRELRDYIAPTRGRLHSTTPQPGDSRKAKPDRSRIVDRTATKAAKDLAAFLQRGITSPARPWFRLKVPDQDLADGGPVRAWLDEVRVRMMAVFQASNFYLAMANIYEELAVFGNGACLIVQDYNDVIRCHPMTIGEYWIGTDDRGKADALYRQYNMTVAQLVKRFGLANCSSVVQQAYDQHQWDREIAVCNAIEGREDHEPGKMGWRGMPVISVWWEIGREAERLLSVSGFKRFPGITPRWDVVANDTYGHGPGEDALPDVKSLQLAKRRREEAVDKQVKPPLKADASMQGSPISLVPGFINFMPRTNGVGLEPLFTVPPHLQSLDQSLIDLKQSIRETFRADLISMFADSDRREMTAAEVRARQEEKMLLLGPMLERFQDEALTPAIEIVFDIMMGGGLFPPLPEELAGRFIEPDYVSLLAQAQKAADTAGIERVAGFVGSLLQAFPEVGDKFDADEATDQMAQLIGASPRIVRSDEAVTGIRKARAEQAAQAKALEQAQQVAGLVQQGAEGARLLSETQVGGGQNALSAMTGL